jgi:hypothetical protein
MAGLSGHPRGSARRMTRGELHGRRALLCKPLLLVAAMSASSLRRRRVVGRVNPRIKSGDGQDGKRSGAQPQGAGPPANATRATKPTPPDEHRLFIVSALPSYVANTNVFQLKNRRRLMRSGLIRG